MTTSAAGLVDQWLSLVLTNDATLAQLGLQGVYDGEGPEGAAYPFVTYLPVRLADDGGMATSYLQSKGTYTITVYDRSDSQAVSVAIGNRIWTLLQGPGPGIFLDGRVNGARRLYSTRRVIAEQGVRTRQYIQVFTVWVQEGGV